jgi:hypothetical protein
VVLRGFLDRPIYNGIIKMGKKYSITLFLMIFVSLYSFCQGIQIESLNGRLTTSLGMEFSNYLYKEPGFMQETGTRHGFFTEFRLNDFIYSDSFLALQLLYVGRSIDYDGATMSGDLLRITDVEDYYLEGRLLRGTVFLKGGSVELHPYFGIGYRYLYDDLGSTRGPGGYERLQRYIYSPIGIDVIHDCANDFALSLNAEYDLFLWGLNTSGKNLFGDVGENFHQYGGYGFRFSGKIIYKNNRQSTIYLEPFFRYWDITTSEKIYSFVEDKESYTYEPNNFTREYGIQLKLALVMF